MAQKKRKGRRAQLHWIVAVLVIATVVLCSLISWQDKNGSLGDLWDIEIPASGQLRELLGELDLLDADGGAGGSPGTTPAGQSKLEVHFLDVGQAESILIKAPKANVLIDAGENNQGEDVLRYLQDQGVNKLDYVIGTHPHSDHIGGMDTIIESLKVDNVILPIIPEEITPTTQTYTDLLLAIGTRGLKITPAKPGKSYDLGDGVSLKIVGPVGEYDDLNNMSVVCRLTCDKVSFLFTGDAEKQAEGDILAGGANIRANVLSVGHHGSSTSTSPVFLQAVAPKIAIISCGIDNSYGHPHREVMEALRERNVEIYRTDLNGAIVAATDGQTVTVTAER